MLLANISVAKKIFQNFPEFAVLRRHPSPPAANYDVLVKAASSKVSHFTWGEGGFPYYCLELMSCTGNVTCYSEIKTNFDYPPLTFNFVTTPLLNVMLYLLRQNLQ